MSFQKYFPIFLVVVLVSQGGCNRGPAKPKNMPDLFPCKITITQGGSPLQGATVILFPKSGGSNGWNTDGVTNDQGVVELKTSMEFKGAPAGEYVVLVSKTELSPSAVPDTPPTDPHEYDHWLNVRAGERRTTFRLVKPEFGDPKKTPHSITIAKGKNEATFDVGEPIKEVIK